MKKARQISDISFLAEEILGDIFSRLPVKTLLQLKVVCTRWCTLISTPWFIYAHLKRFSSDHYILVQTLLRNKGLIPIRNPGCFIKLNEPSMSEYSVVGSINGLVCLTSTCFSKSIYLWNPSINQFKILPLPNLENHKKERKSYVGVGFGYEQNSDDYKVIRILNYDKGRPSIIVEVYSTKLESWKDVKTDHSLNVTTCSCDVIVEGFTYWVLNNMTGPRDTVLASFDLKREIFGLIPIPEVLVAESQRCRVMNYHGSLALLAYSSHNEFKGSLEVWMIEGGSSGEEVWEKKFTFGMGFEFSMHYWGLTSGDIVVKNAPNMPFLFNLRTKQLRIIGTDYIHSVFYYTESLVSVKGFKPVPNQSKEKRRLQFCRRKSKIERTGT